MPFYGVHLAALDRTHVGPARDPLASKRERARRTGFVLIGFSGRWRF